MNASIVVKGERFASNLAGTVEWSSAITTLAQYTEHKIQCS